MAQLVTICHSVMRTWVRAPFTTIRTWSGEFLGFADQRVYKYWQGAHSVKNLALKLRWRAIGEGIRCQSVASYTHAYSHICNYKHVWTLNEHTHTHILALARVIKTNKNTIREFSDTSVLDPLQSGSLHFQC